MNKKLILIGVILIIIAVLASIIMFSLISNDSDSLSKEIFEDLTSDHLEEAFEELDQIDFEISS